jgi:hypothetical protein
MPVRAMNKKFLMLWLVLLVAGCASGGGDRITDFSNRSTAYGWLDIDDVDGNKVYSNLIKQYTPPAKAPYYYTYADSFKGGYLFYLYGLPKGAFKLYSVSLKTCLGIACSNLINTYNFGTQGSIASVRIKKPGVYYLGSYKLIKKKTGFFKRDQFSVIKAKNGPSKKEMLKYLLKHVPGDPIVTKRIRQTLRYTR